MLSTALHSLPSGYRIDPRLGAVYEAIPISADDLTMIRGIETREAVGLNRLGIYFFEQLASWTDSQTAAVASDLGMSPATLLHDRWTAQAYALVAPMPAESPTSPFFQHDFSSAPPASGSRTITVLVCALLIGCCFVSWLNRRTHLPIAGVLTAEITSLRVPADSRLLATHVAVGDEVFTGEILLTLEKSEHVEQISRQAQRVQQLAKDLQRAQARASLELQWRNEQLDHELSSARSRAQFFQTLYPPRNDASAATQSADEELSAGRFQTVSSPHDILPTRSRRVNALLFISGGSGTATLNSRSSHKSPLVTALLPEPGMTSGSVSPDGLLELEAHNIESRLRQLERLRSRLPNQVRLAAGVENLRSQHREAQRRFAHMNSLSRESAVLCPAYGTIGQVRYQEGDRMSRDDVMVRILHTDRRYVVVHAPADRIGELQSGTRVSVLFPDHDPCQGTVADLPMIGDEQLASGKSIVSVRVETVGRPWPQLPVGSKVNVLTQ